ncbi:hypothetical protein EVAR_41393_1 [Eumeta japonica]|uniref:Uncharacterized protein n=1 Tax=Eumeta variegata TaxID=151549 RepID=A0A4C1X1L5_EUMVA|nr:hypothetical protein EVAR_41393_1 [Eumeta japonica]
MFELPRACTWDLPTHSLSLSYSLPLCIFRPLSLSRWNIRHYSLLTLALACNSWVICLAKLIFEVTSTLHTAKPRSVLSKQSNGGSVLRQNGQDHNFECFGNGVVMLHVYRHTLPHMRFGYIRIEDGFYHAPFGKYS